MTSVNKAIILGRLGKDPEIKQTPSGIVIATMTIATSEFRKKEGERVEETEWHRVTAIGKLAEIVNSYCKKGQLVYIEGRLRTKKWQKDGIDRYMTEIIADALQMITKGESKQKDERPAQDSLKDAEDDIPF
jgi:single-strand DNA-binding protein